MKKLYWIYLDIEYDGNSGINSLIYYNIIKIIS
jgi:hypothetical protein